MGSDFLKLTPDPPKKIAAKNIDEIGDEEATTKPDIAEVIDDSDKEKVDGFNDPRMARVKELGGLGGLWVLDAVATIPKHLQH